MIVKDCLGKTNGQIVKVNKINIWYETFGNAKNRPLLLIMGGCCQGVLWHKQFCERLSDEGFYVIRYDHRDSGFSSCFEYEKNPYNLIDMAHDAIGLLNAIRIEKAQIFGVSLGAFLAEIIAGNFPHRVISLLLLGSTCDIRPMNLAYARKQLMNNTMLSPPKQKYLNWLFDFMNHSPQTYEEKLAQRIEGWNQLNGNVFPLDAKANQEIQEEFIARLRHPEVILNHIRMLNTVHSEELVRFAPLKIQQIPTTILQGTEDPILPSDHGYALSKKIKNSEYICIEGMGHIPSDHFYDFYIKILKQQSLS